MSAPITAREFVGEGADGMAHGDRGTSATVATALRRMADLVERDEVGVSSVTVAETARGGDLVRKAMVIRFFEVQGGTR